MDWFWLSNREEQAFRGIQNMCIRGYLRQSGHRRVHRVTVVRVRVLLPASLL